MKNLKKMMRTKKTKKKKRKSKLEVSAEIILRTCLGLKPKESILIIADKNKLKIGRAILKQASYAAAELIEIPIGKVHGEEPPKKIAREMKQFDVIIAPTTKSLTHTKSREDACQAGARIATLPGINESILNRCINVDYCEMARLNQKLKKTLDNGSIIRIATKKGTNLSFSIKGRKAQVDSGILHKKGSSGNLPSGEVFIAPVEGTANGKFIVDASFAGIGKLEGDIEITVRNGLAAEVKGKNAKTVVKWLNHVGKCARNIAEFGIGTNDKAIVTGNLLEDEKVKGTVHLALGNNIYFGGKVDVPFHADGVILKPTVWVDNKLVMDNGILLVK